jgi:hypothetical protein
VEKVNSADSSGVQYFTPPVDASDSQGLLRGPSVPLDGAKVSPALYRARNTLVTIQYAQLFSQGSPQWCASLLSGQKCVCRPPVSPILVQFRWRDQVALDI